MQKPEQKDMFVELEEVAAPVAEYLRKEFNPHADSNYNLRFCKDCYG